MLRAESLPSASVLLTVGDAALRAVVLGGVLSGMLAGRDTLKILDPVVQPVAVLVVDVVLRRNWAEVLHPHKAVFQFSDAVRHVVSVAIQANGTVAIGGSLERGRITMPLEAVIVAAAPTGGHGEFDATFDRTGLRWGLPVLPLDVVGVTMSSHPLVVLRAISGAGSARVPAIWYDAGISHGAI